LYLRLSLREVALRAVGRGLKLGVVEIDLSEFARTSAHTRRFLLKSQLNAAVTVTVYMIQIAGTGAFEVPERQTGVRLSTATRCLLQGAKEEQGAFDKKNGFGLGLGLGFGDGMEESGAASIGTPYDTPTIRGLRFLGDDAEQTQGGILSALGLSPPDPLAGVVLARSSSLGTWAGAAASSHLVGRRG